MFDSKKLPPFKFTEVKTDEGLFDTSIIIKASNGKSIGEVFMDEDGFWGCVHYDIDYGVDFLDTKEEAIHELIALHLDEIC
jgi:hypothetical protein